MTNRGRLRIVFKLAVSEYDPSYQLIYSDPGLVSNDGFCFSCRDVAHISTCDDGCLALADLLGWKVS